MNVWNKVFLVLVLANLLAIGYYLKHKDFQLAVDRGLSTLKKSPLNYIFDRPKNPLESVPFVINNFQNKSNQEHQNITELVRKSHQTSQSNTTVKSNTTKPVYLCINLGAGLANRLYMYASSYGLARDKGMILVIPRGTETLDATFKVKNTYKKDPKLCPKTKHITESACCKLAPNLLKLPSNESVTINGYLQSYKYFEKYRKELKPLLTFRDIVLNEAKAKLHKLLSDKYVGETKNSLYNRTLVGIHIRRGDYTQPQAKAFGYRTATKEYIVKAVDYMKRNFSNVTFIACSNDVQWTNKVFLGHNDVIVAQIGSATIDLALLTLMNHTIITVGTYSFWAAWLNPQNGTVLYYKDFFEPGSRFSRGFASPNTDTYYPYWIGL
ncbi:hypothetical protein LOTGIDRAFT_175102 [Lottia gigantea]|uniref:L-Fucosyltransferase n=1 Tax=Lottia gigantea TaxID=225164 RepID=V4AFG8_LOTGI|nr:hypothetical protein LOTGIDRAFT_175102 [Lottia gigantea]ESO95627.1 hypothetical protein LOTGIDRAFT_175102 [Lottia gigantea]